MQDHCSRSPQGDGQFPAARAPRPVVVSAADRDAIFPELMIVPSRIGDVSVFEDRADYEEAAASAREMRDVTRLVDDFGWDPDGTADSYEITLSAGELARLVYRLQTQTARALADEIPEAQETELPYRESLRAIAANGAILTKLDDAASAWQSTPSAGRGMGEGV
jgi:hypothetical protein